MRASQNTHEESDAVIPSGPFAVAFEIISSCNLSCSYCYAKPFNGLSIPKRDLDYLFSKTKEEVDPFKVTIEGGEPFLRKDISEILLTAKEYFGNVAVVTNGTLLEKLSEPVLCDLRKFAAGSPSIQVSLDASEPSINDSVRGLCSRTLSGLNTLDQNDIPFAVGIVMTRINVHHIVATIRFLVETYKNLRNIHLMNVMPSQSLGRQWSNLKVEANDSIDLSKHLKDILASLSDRDLTISEPTAIACANEHTLLDRQKLIRCTAGFLRVTVLANGDIIPCEMTRSAIIGNLFESSWREIWRRSIESYFESDIEGGFCFSKNLPPAVI